MSFNNPRLEKIVSGKCGILLFGSLSQDEPRILTDLSHYHISNKTWVFANRESVCDTKGESPKNSRKYYLGYGRRVYEFFKDPVDVNAPLLIFANVYREGKVFWELFDVLKDYVGVKPDNVFVRFNELYRLGFFDTNGVNDVWMRIQEHSSRSTDTWFSLEKL